MTAPTPDLPPEVRAAIERVLAIHHGLYCDACNMGHPCPTRTELQALLPPETPTIEVTDEMVVALWQVMWPGHASRTGEFTAATERLANSALCPAAWLPAPPEDDRVRELREAAATVVERNKAGYLLQPREADRLRAALQAWDEPT